MRLRALRAVQRVTLAAWGQRLLRLRLVPQAAAAVLTKVVRVVAVVIIAARTTMTTAAALALVQRVPKQMRVQSARVWA